MHNVHLESFDVMEAYMALEVEKRMCSVGDYVTYKTTFEQDDEVRLSNNRFLTLQIISHDTGTGCLWLTHSLHKEKDDREVLLHYTEV